MKPKTQEIFIDSIHALRTWLHTHHDTRESVWLVRWKKESGKPYLSYDDIVDQLICFGWVDSLPRKLDAQRTMLRISPRNPKSNWSGINKDRVARLTRQDRMESAGLHLVAKAKENGSWTFLDDVEQLILPSDLLARLKAHPRSAYYFDRFPNSSKRGILEWIKNAKTTKTRKHRIEETALKASKNIKVNHPAGRDAGPQEDK